MTKTTASPKHTYQALRAFMHGYLHEDYVDEYGSAVSAVHEFRSDADDDEFNNVAREWRQFVHDTKSQTVQAIQKRIREELGGGWLPNSMADLQSITNAFQHPREKDEEE